MKRVILLLLVIILFIPVVTSCKSEEAYNDLGLFANNFAEHDGWIYYTEWDSTELYKV